MIWTALSKVRYSIATFIGKIQRLVLTNLFHVFQVSTTCSSAPSFLLQDGVQMKLSVYNIPTQLYLFAVG